MGQVLHEGWAILAFIGRAPLAGLLRYEQVGMVHQWVLNVPPCHHHSGYAVFIEAASGPWPRAANGRRWPSRRRRRRCASCLGPTGRYFGRWLAWEDVKLGGKPRDPHLGGRERGIYVFSSHRSELEKVLKYMRGEGPPDHVVGQVAETCLTN